MKKKEQKEKKNKKGAKEKKDYVVFNGVKCYSEKDMLEQLKKIDIKR